MHRPRSNRSCVALSGNQGRTREEARDKVLAALHTVLPPDDELGSTRKQRPRRAPIQPKMRHRGRRRNLDGFVQALMEPTQREARRRALEAMRPPADVRTGVYY
jgi:hypothetical protein